MAAECHPLTKRNSFNSVDCVTLKNTSVLVSTLPNHMSHYDIVCVFSQGYF